MHTVHMENTSTPRAADQSALVLDLTSDGIPADDLAIALANAKRDPDGQVYPWLPGYPLAGATVAYDGRLWTVAGKERGVSADSPGAVVRLGGQGHDDSATACAYELRPVTWTALDELELEVTRAAIRERIAAAPDFVPAVRS